MVSPEMFPNVKEYFFLSKDQQREKDQVTISAINYNENVRSQANKMGEL